MEELEGTTRGQPLHSYNGIADTESRSGWGWMGPQRSPSSNLLPWAGYQPPNQAPDVSPGSMQCTPIHRCGLLWHQNSISYLGLSCSSVRFLFPHVAGSQQSHWDVLVLFFFPPGCKIRRNRYTHPAEEPLSRVFAWEPVPGRCTTKGSGQIKMQLQHWDFS